MYKSLNFDLKTMFYEKGENAKCYKSLSRWDMAFEREMAMQELIIKKALEDTASDTKYGQASRNYLWTLMTESIFLDNPIEFYSQRMKNQFALPDFRMSMTKPKPPKKAGKDLRETIEIDGCSMVIPNTFEADKWKTPEKNPILDLPPKLPVKEKIEKLKESQKELTFHDHLRIKYGSF